MGGGIGTLGIVAALILLIVAGAALADRGRRRRLDAFLRAGFGRQPGDRDLSIDSIRRYSDACAPGKAAVDKTTWDDLSMDDVFRRINACRSSVGEEVLYARLHDLQPGPDHLAREAALRAWLSQEENRLAVGRPLMGLGRRDDNGLTRFLFFSEEKRIPHAWIFPVLAALPVGFLALAPLLKAAALVGAALCLFVNGAVYMAFKLRMEGELETLQYFGALVWCAKRLKKALPEELSHDLAKALRPFAKLAGFLSSDMQRGAEELAALVAFFQMLFLTDLLRYNLTLRAMRMHAEALRTLFQTVGEIDAAVSVLSFRKSLPFFCEPEFLPERRLRFEEVYHPLLTHPVSNSGELLGGWLITGSNASGKSTFVKALAVNAILAQTISTCAARRFALFYAQVFTSMAVRDDLLAGESYFVSEIRSLLRIVHACERSRCLCFVDEILRGTNTGERIAASSAVLRHLAHTDSLIVVATHDLELTDLLNGLYANFHFRETVSGDGVHFDYRLHDGPSRTTNAILLLEKMGFPGEVTAAARELYRARNDAPAD